VAMRSPLQSVSRRNRRVLITVVTLLLLVIVLSSTVNLYADWLWYGEVGFTDVMSTTLRTRLVLFVLVGGAVAVFVAANLLIAFRLRPAYRPMSLEQQNLERYRLTITPRFTLLVSVFAAFVWLITGLAAQGRWRTWLLFSNSTPFGKEDPQFGLDLSFYVFEYPFWRYVLGVAFTAVVLSIVASLFVHYLYGGVRLQGSGGRMSAAVIGHLSVLLGLFVALKSVAYYLDRYGLLFAFGDVSKVNGASAVDIEWLLPAKNILLWIAALCALVFFVNVGIRRVLLPGMALVLLLVSAVVLGGAVPAISEQVSIKPNAREREAEYIGRNIAATREAYGLADITRQAYAAETTSTKEEIRGDTGTIPNARLLDPSVLSDSFTQLQQVRNFYGFNEQLDVDRYTVDGKSQDYVVGVRELKSTELTGNQTNWLNRHTSFTHGNGFVAAPANQVDADGDPIFVSGILGEEGGGPQAQEFAQAVPIKEPRIYYGELIRDYSVVGKAPGGKDKEFDRPAGGAEENDGEQISTTYSGKGGVKVGSAFRQLVYATYFRESNFVLSDAVNENSKVLYVRDPRARVEKVAPFLTVDGDPYPIVVDGRVVWVIDGYTTSNSYPYGQRELLGDVAQDSLTGQGTARLAQDEINYIRNSVKATVDAYDGTVTLYEWDESDPVLKTWNKAYGGDIIRPKSEIKPQLAAHFRYPEDLFKVQRTVLSRYHVSDPGEFFGGQDFWKVPDDPTKANSAPQPPYYVVGQFPGQEEPRFQLITAVTANRRENLQALITASYDDDGKPGIQVLELPGNSPILGPNQVQPKMQNDQISRESLTLLNSEQSRVVFGNLLTLPVGGGLLYVEPVYIRGTGTNAYPQLTKVLVAFGDEVGYADTLPQALDALFGAGSAPPATPTKPSTPTAPAPPNNQDPSTASAVAAIKTALESLRTAQQKGDFAGIGKAQEDLANAIKQFETAQSQPRTTQSPTPRPTPSG
jgi:uncharacterized membrane protein (UPF0182 family)